jgi:hypothetical protein
LVCGTEAVAVSVAVAEAAAAARTAAEKLRQVMTVAREGRLRRRWKAVAPPPLRRLQEESVAIASCDDI